jgi:DNA-binding transcriptional regulator LsrR (DeoR family)
VPRLTIYVPDDLAHALKRHPGKLNVSQVCADALRAQLEARGTLDSLEGLFTALFNDPWTVEADLMRKFGLRRVVAPPFGKDVPPVDAVAGWASTYLNEGLFEGVHLALGGGNQMWQIARRLEPRSLGLPVWALGFRDVDRELPNVHPNALVTLLAMLYGSRTKARLVGDPEFKKYWVYPSQSPPGKELKRMIVASCSMFDADSPWARLLGEDITTFLEEEHVLGDFLGLFITPDGRILEPYPGSMTQSHIGAADLERFAKREDTLVMLAAAGGHKVKLIRQVLTMGLCNAVVTDEATARAL